MVTFPFTGWLFFSKNIGINHDMALQDIIMFLVTILLANYVNVSSVEAGCRFVLSKLWVNYHCPTQNADSVYRVFTLVYN